MSVQVDRRRFLRDATAFVAAMHSPLLTMPAHAQEWKKQLHIRHLVLNSNNIAEQLDFYRSVLRLPAGFGDHGALEVNVGSSVLEFQQGEPDENAFYHVAFTIPENKIEEARAWLEPRCPILDVNRRGDKVMHFRNWNAHSIFFLDPANNILEFIGHHDLNNRSDSEFDESQIKYISEIGLIVPDVPQCVGALNEQFGLNSYRGGSERFTAVGDIGGLLIVVQEGRTWFPTADTNSKVHPTEIHIAALDSTLRDGQRSKQYDFPNLPYRIVS